MNLHCFLHSSFEGPAAIEEWAKSRNHSFTFTRFYENKEIPDADEIDGLIIMGGPMGVYEQDKYPWLKDEIAFIKSAIENEKQVFGVCLGAQLIAHALGARVYPHKQKEIGWFPIEKTRERDDRFHDFPSPLTVLHWHGDTYDLPRGAKNLFRSAICENQAFSFADNVIGVQFHLEASEDILKMVTGLAKDLRMEQKQQGAFQYVQNKAEILKEVHRTKTLKPILFQLLDNFFDEDL
jgi:GMP synthase (glutamine-hydrolysing)